jgi:hypothetical protein
MEGDRNFQLRLERNGLFDGWRIVGRQFEDGRGVLAWRIDTVPRSNDPSDDCWVEDGEFYEIIGRQLATPTARIETGDTITGMDAAKRNAILKAIAEWEKPVDVEDNKSRKLVHREK